MIAQGEGLGNSRVRARAGLGQRGRLLELGLLAAILLLAAWLRLPDLGYRGPWDSDQGRDMAVIQSIAQGRDLPLLGPSTSVGGFHHGVVYDYLLAPVAAISGSDPEAVTAVIALAGVAAVAAIAWLGRLAGGPLAGLVSGLLAAVSPSLIQSSIFLWEPNLIPLAAAVGLAGVLQARRGGRARWWLVAGLGIGLAAQLHVLATLLFVPLAWAWVDDLRRRRRSGRPTRAVVRGGIGGVALIALGYLPLGVHELTSGFSEVRALIANAGIGGGSGQSAGLLQRVLMVPVRTLTWPVAGLVSDNVIASMLALAIVLALIAAAWLLTGRGAADTHDEATADEATADDRRTGQTAGDPGRWPIGWLIGTLVFSVIALVFLAPSLAVITPGLPNDHYHAFLDPVVLALAGVGIARIALLTWTPTRSGRQATRAVGPAIAVGLTACLLGVSVASWPPTVAPDGGWRLADAAAGHVIELVDSARQPGEPAVLVSLPTFKPDDAMRFPLTRRGLDLQPPITGSVTPGSVPTGVVTVVCDPLFDDATGVPCGGPAEDAWLAMAYPPGTMQLVQRFRAGDRRVLSVYAPSRLAVASAN